MRTSGRIPITPPGHGIECDWCDLEANHHWIVSVTGHKERACDLHAMQYGPIPSLWRPLHETPNNCGKGTFPFAEPYLNEGVES